MRAILSLLVLVIIIGMWAGDSEPEMPESLDDLDD